METIFIPHKLANRIYQGFRRAEIYQHTIAPTYFPRCISPSTSSITSLLPSFHSLCYYLTRPILGLRSICSFCQEHSPPAPGPYLSMKILRILRTRLKPSSYKCYKIPLANHQPKMCLSPYTPRALVPLIKTGSSIVGLGWCFIVHMVAFFTSVWLFGQSRQLHIHLAFLCSIQQNALYHRKWLMMMTVMMIIIIGLKCTAKKHESWSYHDAHTWKSSKWQKEK